MRREMTSEELLWLKKDLFVKISEQYTVSLFRKKPEVEHATNSHIES